MKFKSALTAFVACAAAVVSFTSRAELLPEGYFRVEYIQSSGAQYIDTGINIQDKLVTEIDYVPFVEAKASVYMLAANGRIDGKLGNREYMVSTAESGAWRVGVGAAVSVPTTSITAAAAKKRYLVTTSVNGKTQSVSVKNISDGTAVQNWSKADNTGLSSMGEPRTHYLFALHSGEGSFEGSASSKSSSKLYSCTIKTNTTVLARDYIPCYGIAEKQFGLYDMVSGTFFVSEGTEAFTGPYVKTGTLTVSGDPANVGSVEPAYGSTTGYADGQVVTCTATPTWTSGEAGGRCLGYTVYTNGVVSQEGTFAEGDPCTFEYVHRSVSLGGTKLVWHWSVPTVYVALPAPDGAGDDANDGSDWAHPMATIQKAVDKYAVSRVVVSNGVHKITGSPIQITNAVTLVGFGETWSGAQIRRTSGEKRIMRIAHSQAVVTNLYLTTNGSKLMGGVDVEKGLLVGCRLQYIAKKNLSDDVAKGGGANVSGGTVRGCLFANCRATSSGGGGGDGGGVYMTSGLVENCVISNCNDSSCEGTTSKGGGVCMTGGTLRGCLVAANRAANTGYGVYATGGTVENCTIADNFYTTGSKGYGAYVSKSGVTFRNNIIWNNKAPGDVLANISTSATCQNCCSNPKISNGTGNINEDPMFNADYTLGFSGCVDGGLEQVWMVGAKDGIGNDRIIGCGVDIGCYERPAQTGLDCSFMAKTDGGVDSAVVSLESTVSGDTTGLVYYWKVWDLDGNLVKDIEGADEASPAFTLGANIYTVQLAVTNAHHHGNEALQADAVKVGASVVYVNVNGTDVRPYATVESGAHDFEQAFQLLASGGTVYVADGRYAIANRIQLMSGNGAKVVSLNGPANCVIYPSAKSTFASLKMPMFELTAANARLEGLTLTGGSVSTYGIVAMGGSSVIVTNCVIRDVTGVDRGPKGAGVNMSQGTLVDTTIANVEENMSGASSVQGVAITMSGGTVERVAVTNCQTTAGNIAAPGVGDIVWASGGTLRNVLVAGCTARHSVPVYVGGAVTMENCSIVGNVNTENKASFVYNNKTYDNNHCAGLQAESGATVVNTVLADNWSNFANSESNLYASATLSFDHCLIADRTAQAGEGNVFEHPKYRNRAVGDWRLRGGSAGVDAGVRLPWMAGGLDLIRAKRIQGPEPDMGCYETFRPGLMIMIW